ncbi:hypothetical protein HAX54_021458 [Datura stramonium]|uniref:Uncharacterized protein n=1 Tax=Datura stramonium TaxID=4076 RepID=A0ABS8USZ3_DATST|nr:hypothetical protein [Datura stramonium]
MISIRRNTCCKVNRSSRLKKSINDTCQRRCRGELTAAGGKRFLREMYDTDLIEKISKLSVTEFVNDDEGDEDDVASKARNALESMELPRWNTFQELVTQFQNHLLKRQREDRCPNLANLHMILTTLPSCASLML